MNWLPNSIPLRHLVPERLKSQLYPVNWRQLTIGMAVRLARLVRHAKSSLNLPRPCYTCQGLDSLSRSRKFAKVSLHMAGDTGDEVRSSGWDQFDKGVARSNVTARIRWVVTRVTCERSVISSVDREKEECCH